MDEEGPDLEVFRELCLATDLALWAAKRMAVGCSMGSMVILNRHLWLTLTEMKKTSLLDATVSPQGLFDDAVCMFFERFSEAQKQSKAMSHFLHRHAGAAQPEHSRSSSA